MTTYKPLTDEELDDELGFSRSTDYKRIALAYAAYLGDET